MITMSAAAEKRVRTPKHQAKPAEELADRHEVALRPLSLDELRHARPTEQAEQDLGAVEQKDHPQHDADDEKGEIDGGAVGSGFHIFHYESCS